jgi:hypothetical protein
MKMRVVAAGLFATGAMQAASLPHIEPAESGVASDERCMTIPKGVVDWRAVAESELGESVVDKPGEQRLIPFYVHDLQGSTVRLVAPAPLSITQGTWQLVHENGVSAFHPTVLRIEIYYPADDTLGLERASPSGFRGKVCGKVPSKTGRAAFAMSGARQGAWSMKVVQFTAAPDSAVRFRIGGSDVALREPHAGSDAVKRAMLLQSGTKRLLLVAWDNSRRSSACDHEYSLYEVTKSGLRPVKESNYGCDI